MLKMTKSREVEGGNNKRAKMNTVEKLKKIQYNEED